MMSPEARDKLARIVELMNKKDEIETELEALIGGQITAPGAVKPNGGKGRPTSDRTCGKCLRKGHNARTCPGAGNDVEEPVSEDAGGIEALTEDQWNSVKEAQKMDANSSDIADEVSTSIREVNKAMMSRSYSAYLILRKQD